MQVHSPFQRKTRQGQKSFHRHVHQVATSCSTWFHPPSPGNCCSRPRGTSNHSDAANDQGFLWGKERYRRYLSNELWPQQRRGWHMYVSVSILSLHSTDYCEAASSKLLLNGRILEKLSALNNSRAKSHIIKSEKIARSPHGMGVVG